METGKRPHAARSRSCGIVTWPSAIWDNAIPGSELDAIAITPAKNGMHYLSSVCRIRLRVIPGAGADLEAWLVYFDLKTVILIRTVRRRGFE
jgi:hypothetical protein